MVNKQIKSRHIILNAFSQGAITSMTRALAVDEAKHGVRVNRYWNIFNEVR